VLELFAHRIERPDRRLEGAVEDAYDERHLSCLGLPLEERVDGQLEILESLIREVQAHGETAEHQMRYAVKRIVCRQRQGNLVAAQLIASNPTRR
jgi:hypothetical protein